MPTRYTKQGELQQLQYEITNEISRDAEPIARGVFGDNAKHPDMASVSNTELDQMYRDAFVRNDRQWLQQEAQRDPEQFLKVTDRIGVPDPPTDLSGKPVGLEPDSLQKSLNQPQAPPVPELPSPVAPPPGAPPSPVPPSPVTAPLAAQPMPAGPPLAGVGAPAVPVILGPNGQPLPPSLGQPT